MHLQRDQIEHNQSYLAFLVQRHESESTMARVSCFVS